jgi:hypothetical protein
MSEINSLEGIVGGFLERLEANRVKAEMKKEEYLERIMQIFR